MITKRTMIFGSAVIAMVPVESQGFVERWPEYRVVAEGRGFQVLQCPAPDDGSYAHTIEFRVETVNASVAWSYVLYEGPEDSIHESRRSIYLDRRRLATINVDFRTHKRICRLKPKNMRRDADGNFLFIHPVQVFEGEIDAVCDQVLDELFERDKITGCDKSWLKLKNHRDLPSMMADARMMGWPGPMTGRS